MIKAIVKHIPFSKKRRLPINVETMLMVIMTAIAITSIVSYVTNIGIDSIINKIIPGEESERIFLVIVYLLSCVLAYESLNKVEDDKYKKEETLRENTVNVIKEYMKSEEYLNIKKHIDSKERSSHNQDDVPIEMTESIIDEMPRWRMDSMYDFEEMSETDTKNLVYRYKAIEHLEDLGFKLREINASIKENRIDAVMSKGDEVMYVKASLSAFKTIINKDHLDEFLRELPKNTLEELINKTKRTFIYITPGVIELDNKATKYLLEKGIGITIETLSE